MTGRFVITLDLVRGTFEHTPASAAAEGCTAVSRGYIANAGALRDEARRRGCAVPASDDGLFALAYRWWGLELQDKVLGEYAVAVYDAHERRLLVTRDAIGIVPVFVADGPQRLVAASHLDDLRRVVGDEGLDEEYFADHLAIGRPVGGHTPYRGIRRLRPGRSLEWKHDRVREHQTWSIARTPALRLASDGQYDERARELIAEAVRSSLRADGPIWSELSGGLDSSTIHSVAATSCGRALPALSIVYERSRSGDERPWMRAVVQRFELPWHTVDADAAAPFTELAPPFAEPSSLMSAWAVYRRYRELVERHGVEIVLAGHGGDLIFGGDAQEPHHLADPLVRLDLLGFARGVARWQRASPFKRSMLHWIAANGVTPLVRQWRGQTLRADGSSSFRIAEWIEPRYARAMHLYERMHRRYAPRCDTPYRQFFADNLGLIGEMAGTARNGIAESFSIRSPLLYRPLVEFFFAIPPEQRVQADRGRVLQRRALAGILPEQIRKRGGKRGAQESYFEGLRTSSTWLPMLRQPPLVAERGYVDAARWRQTVERARFGRAETMHQFIDTATLECWFRQLDDVQSPTLTPFRGETDARQPVFQP